MASQVMGSQSFYSPANQNNEINAGPFTVVISKSPNPAYTRLLPQSPPQEMTQPLSTRLAGSAQGYMTARLYAYKKLSVPLRCVLCALYNSTAAGGAWVGPQAKQSGGFQVL